MLVVEMPSEILRLGQPAPVTVRDANGQMLIRKGTLVASEAQRQRLISRTLYVDESEGEMLKRILSGQLDALLRQNAALGEMARVQTDASGLIAPPAPKPAMAPVPAWAHLQMCAGVLLRDPVPAEFTARLDSLQSEVAERVAADADETLLILINLLARDPHQQHATQALLAAVVSGLLARSANRFTPAQLTSLRCAALTRNLAMATTQDQLALQDDSPTPQQLAKIEGHVTRGLQCLRDAGVTDEVWLEVVAQHHAAPAAGPLESLPLVHQLARILEWTDRLTGQMSVRKTRPAPAAAVAIKAACRGAQGQGVDEVGALAVKVLGIYPPGSYVRLSSGEIGVVLKRGVNATTPKVASLFSKSGAALAEPIVRDTRRRPHDVAASVAPHEVKVRLNMDKLVQLG